MTCHELAELLLDYIGGELSPEDDARIQLHLGQCPPCVCFIETYRLTVTLTRRLPAAQMPAEVAGRLQAALRGAPPPGSAPR